MSNQKARSHQPLECWDQSIFTHQCCLTFTIYRSTNSGRTIALMLGVALSFILSSFIFSITSIVKAEPFSDREEINVGTNPFNMIYNPDNGNLYVVDNPSNTVYVISRSNNQIIGSISVNLHPDRIVYDPDNHNLYLLHRFPQW
jgi:YVTN family beta-propeller protein